MCISKFSVPELSYGVLSELIKLNFFREHVQRHVDRPSQPSSALVIVNDSLETVPMAVKIVLITDGVEVPNTSGWITQQCIRELIEGTNLGLISKTTDLQRYINKMVKTKPILYISCW